MMNPLRNFYTSWSIIGMIRSFFGVSIGFDPLLCKRPNEVAPATLYSTKEMDGLKLNWYSNKIFLNPPFGEMKKWAPKVMHEYSVLYEGHVKDAFVLVLFREATWLTQLLSTAMLAHLPTKEKENLHFGRIGKITLPSVIWLYCDTSDLNQK